MARLPGSFASTASVKMSATCPMALCMKRRSPLEDTTPADSCPRCCNWCSPRYAMVEASRWLCTAITPHSSLNLSLRSNPLKSSSPGKGMLLLLLTARRGDRPRRSSLKRNLSLRSTPLKVRLPRLNVFSACFLQLGAWSASLLGLSGQVPTTNYHLPPSSSSATLPVPDAPAHPHAGPSITPCPKPVADQTPLRRPPACRQWISLVFQESCARSGPPVRPILPLFVG